VHGGDAIEWNAEAVGGAGTEVDGGAVAAVGDGHREGAASVGDAYSGAAGEPGVGGGDAPVLVRLAAIRGAAVIIRVISSSCYWPSVAS